MKTILTSFVLSFFVLSSLYAQSTMVRVYEILQEKCATCHSHENPQSGLDLEESGSTAQIRALKVHGNLYNVTPANTYAAGKGYKYVYPGRSDISYLFRKINLDLEETITLHGEEQGAMPPENSPQLTIEEKELIRQWILFGAKSSGTQVDENLISDYYNNNGQESFPDGPPEAPAEEEGFQIKMGPFFLEPGAELEYFSKYELDLPADVDVDRIEIFMSNYSHHFILYDFNNGGDQSIPHGLRTNANHSDIGLVAALQEPTDLRLPGGTAFIWDNNKVLDLNTHYINYSAFMSYKAENYINVYTKPSGTAAQEMKTELLANFNIPIPNNGNVITHTEHITYNLGEVFLWGIMGHTHQYGTDYKVYERLSGGAQGDLIYDAACAQGVPGCVSPFFDYQHIPIRYFEPLMPLTLNWQNGIIHEASWINDGPTPVNFGPTSDDEMMVLILMYTEDTTGVFTTNVEDIYNPLDEVQIFPNPVKQTATVTLPVGVENIRFTLFDATGRAVLQRAEQGNSLFEFSRAALPSGMYFYRIEDEFGRFKSGKLLFE